MGSVASWLSGKSPAPTQKLTIISLGPKEAGSSEGGAALRSLERKIGAMKGQYLRASSSAKCIKPSTLPSLIRFAAANRSMMEHMCNSTLMAIMGRAAAYTGQEITWEQALNSEEKLVPDHLDWNMSLPIAPMA